MLDRPVRLPNRASCPGCLHCAQKCNFWNYFALGFGTMIGTGWVVVMDDWLGRGGPLGAMLGFALGGVLLLPVSYVYGEWVKRLPDASGEAAYTAQVFPPFVQLYHGLGHVAGVFYRVPVGGCGCRKTGGVSFPAVGCVGVVPDCRRAYFFCQGCCWALC